MTGPELIEWSLLLLLAGGLGAVVGLERELQGHPAGLRTQALVAMAAALATAVGASFTEGSADPSRIAAQVMTGIGFIGAGVILRQGMSVIGLTTAATLWVSAAIGVAVGVGFYGPAVLATVIAFVISYGLGLLKPFIAARGNRVLEVEYEQGHGTIGPLIRDIRERNLTIRSIDVEDEEGEGGLRRVSIRIAGHSADELEGVLETLSNRPEVRNAAVN